MKQRATPMLRLLCSLAVSAAYGCAGQSGTEIERPACHDVDSSPIGADEASPVGSPSELARGTASAQRGELRWFLHTADSLVPHVTAMELQVTADPNQAKRISGGCGAALELQATLKLTTADGAFLDTFAGTLRIQEQGVIRFRGTLPVADQVGSYDASRVVVHYRRPQFSLYSFFNLGDGMLSIDEAAPQSGSGPTSVSATVAEWSAASSLHAPLDAGL